MDEVFYLFRQRDLLPVEDRTRQRFKPLSTALTSVSPDSVCVFPVLRDMAGVTCRAFADMESVYHLDLPRRRKRMLCQIPLVHGVEYHLIGRILAILKFQKSSPKRTRGKVFVFFLFHMAVVVPAVGRQGNNRQVIALVSPPPKTIKLLPP